MLTMLPPARPARQALLFAPALFIAISSIARSTGEWNDFRGYIIAGEALRQGLYSDHVSNTWPPFFSLFAAALIELQRLPAPAARVLWGSFNAVIFGIACARWFVASRSMEAPLWVAPAAAFAIAPFLALHLVTHQVYALVFAMAIELFIAAQRGDDAAAGVWLGVSASLKITPLLTLPYFLLQRRWKLAATACATAALCSLAVAPALGMRGDIDAHLRWIRRAASLRGTHGVRNQSIEALVERLTTGEAKLEVSGIDPIVSLNQPTADRIGKVLSWLLVLGGAFALRRTRPIEAAPPLLAISVLAVPYCWRTQLIALAPLLFVSFRRLRKPDLLDVLLLLPFFLAVVEREPGLIGLDNFLLLEGAGLTAALALLLILDALRLRHRETLRISPEDSGGAIPARTA